MPSNLRDICLENEALQMLVEQQETVIVELNEKIRELSSLNEPHPTLEQFVHPHLLLSEEIILESNLDITTSPKYTKLNISNQIKPSEQKKYALMLQKYLGIILRYFLKIIYQTFVNVYHLSSTPTIFGLILIISFVTFNQLICIRDEVTVNAWWYLKEKVTIENKRF
jgi:hypothetical protein